MEKQDFAVGLDIGTTKIVALVGRKNEYGKLEILGMGKAKSLGVHRGIVNNITLTINSIKEAIAQAEAAAGVKIKDVTVGIAGQHIRSLQHSDYITRTNFEDVIDENDIEDLKNQVYKLVMLPGEEIIHVLPQEFKVDSQSEIQEPKGMYGSRLEANFHVVVGQITLIKNIARCVRSAGLNLAGITLEPLASASAVLSQEEKEAGVALVDIGGGTTDIAVFKDNIIRHTSVIPFGGNVITEDIKIGCSIIERRAEQLKVKFGSAFPDAVKETEVVTIPGIAGGDSKEISFKKLSQIIYARVEEILNQVCLELQNYGYDDQRKKLIAGMVMSGGGSNLKHLRQVTEYVTGMDVRVGASNQHFASKQSDEFLKPEYATAVGLLMEGLEKMEPMMPNSSNMEEVSDVTLEEQDELENPQLRQEDKTPADDESKEEKKKKKLIKQKSKKGFLSSWSEKFIEFINDTE